MIAWMYHDSTKARRLRNEQPLRWGEVNWYRVVGLVILIVSLVTLWRLV